jgi:nucleoside-diphosphate-sugar epimerase
MKVCVLGAGGFIGKNLLRDTDWVGVTRQELDLTDLGSVEKYFQEHEYDVVIHCAVIGGSRLKPDNGEVFYKNLLMFESVTRAFKGRILYFSSGAALRGDPPTDPYGLSKRLIEHRIDTIPNAHVLRIWGCYGPGELPTRFSAICKREGHVVIDQDRYFDFIDIEDVKKMVEEYVSCKWKMPKVCNLVYPEKLLLSQWAEKFGATWEVKDPSSLGECYTSVPA